MPARYLGKSNHATLRATTDGFLTNVHSGTFCESTLWTTFVEHGVKTADVDNGCVDNGRTCSHACTHAPGWATMGT